MTEKKKCYWDMRFNCFHPEDWKKCLDGTIHPGKEACEEFTLALKKAKGLLN